MNRQSTVEKILLDVGFSRVGWAEASPYRDSDKFPEWLEKGYHGEMTYLERQPERRMDPTHVRDWAQSLIMVALDYNTDHPSTPWEKMDPERGWISRYAWGTDYHEVIEKMFKKALPELEKSTGAQFRYYVDHGPILEKLAGRRAGLGWMGKNTLLLHPKAGSWFFLGCMVTDLEMPVGPIELEDRCGSCTACLDICPTEAFPQPYVLDARKCISYQSIERKVDVGGGPGPLHGHLFGCDLCQDVCPWNRKAPFTEQEAFEPRDGLYYPRLENVEQWSVESFREKARKSPLKRRKLEGLRWSVLSLKRESEEKSD